MIISGTYFDRLLYCVFPYSLLLIIMFGGFGVFIPNFQISIAIIPICGFTIFFSLLNIILAYFQRFKTLTLFDSTILFDEEEISTSNIIQIEADDFVRGRFRISAIKFIVNENGKQLSYRIMAKPCWPFSNHSKTFDLLFERLPELKNKLVN